VSERVGAGAPPADAESLLDIAISTARRAGELLLERFSLPAQGVSTKGSPTDLVSDADRDSERLLLELIAKRRPNDGVVSEEGDNRASSSGVTWIVDPLDGTVNFLFGIPAWGVSIAVEDEAGTVAGVVHDPTRRETFSAARGLGTRLNDRRVQVSARKELATALVGTGFSYSRERRAAQADVVRRVIPRARDIRRAGSAALDLAYVSCGRLDCFYESDMKVWDNSAGALLVREAGGVVSPLRDPVGGVEGVIAGGRALHDELRALLVG
jgi:fructose-1,6-bisphosphatase/inositol monophosphatase family enzyme